MAEPYAFVTKSRDVILASTLNQYAIKADGEGQSRGLPEDTYNNYDTDGIKRPLYNPKALVQLLELNTYHARIMKQRATDVGGLGHILEPIGDNPDEQEKERLQEFIDNCKPLFAEITTRSSHDKAAVGYGVIETPRIGNLADSEFDRLVHLPSHTFKVHKEGNKYLQSWDGITKRWFKRIGYDKDIHIDTGREFRLGSLDPEERATEIIFDMNYTPLSTYYGAPDIVPALQTIIGDISAVKYNISFFRNYGIPDYAIFIIGDFEDTEATDPNTGKGLGKSKVQQAIEKKMQRVIDKPHSNMVITIPSPAGADDVKVKVIFEKLSVEVKDASFRWYRQDNRDEIIIADRGDQYRAGVNPTGALGGNLAAEAKKNYKTGTVVPDQRLLEAYINVYIIKENLGIKTWKLKLITIDTDDLEFKLKATESIFDRGGATPNQVIRVWKNMFPQLEESDHPAMDAHYINGQPIDYQPEGPLTKEVVKKLDILGDSILEVANTYDKSIKKDSSEDKGISGAIKRITGKARSS